MKDNEELTVMERIENLEVKTERLNSEVTWAIILQLVFIIAISVLIFWG